MKVMPQRTCVLCRKKEEKNKLIRYALVENAVQEDATHHAGRGVYLCSQCRDTYIQASEKEKEKIVKRMLFSLHHTKG